MPTLSVRCDFFSGDSRVGSETLLPPSPLPQEGLWHREYQLAIELPEKCVEKTELTTRIGCEEAWYLSPARRLMPLHGERNPPFPVGRFVITRTFGGLFKWEFPQGACFRFRKLRTAVEVECVVHNAYGCGFALHNEKRMKAPPLIHIEIHRNRLRKLSECLWTEPYPDAARAAVCLTDHADFDSVDGLALLVDLFTRHDIRLTKSVFPVAEPLGAKREPGLDVPAYRALITKLYEQGSAIAFHGFGPRKRTPSKEECLRRSERLKQFQPKTWIDHGCGDYLLSRRALLEDGTPLTRFLEQFGIVNYWSYVDIRDNPFGVLSCWRPQRRLQSVASLLQAIARMPDTVLSGHRMGYQLLHVCKNLFGDAGVQQIRRSPGSWRHWCRAIRQGSRMRRLREQPMLVYGEGGVSANIRCGQRWIFDTVILNHLGAQLRPSALDALCEDSGLLLAHCYMGALQSKCTHNCLAESNGKLQIAPSFLAAVEHLSYRQRERDLVSLSFRDLRESLEAFTRARLIRHEHGWFAKASASETCRVLVGGARDTITAAHCGGCRKELRGHVGYVLPGKDKDLDIRFTAQLPRQTAAHS